MILSLGRIRIADQGVIRANGGGGGGGENTSGLNRVGGGSGGGSGGHVVLQASEIDFTDSNVNAIRAIGGRGGVGANNQVNVTGAGGDGGPGIIQLHVPDPVEDILLPAGLTLQSRTAPDPLELLPLFGPRSRARSVWIPLGGASFDPGGGTDPVPFTFGGIDPATGDVLDADGDGVVDDLPPILGPALLAAEPALPFVAADGRTLVVDASPLADTQDDVYLRNPELLKSFALVLAQADDPAVSQRYDVASASYDPAALRLELTVAAGGPDLFALDPVGPGGAVEFRLIPRFFRVATDGLADALPPNVRIQLLFEGAAADGDGAPDLSSGPLVPATSDIALLDVPGLAYFRFEVLFDVAANGGGLAPDAPIPALEYLRLPFRF